MARCPPFLILEKVIFEHSALGDPAGANTYPPKPPGPPISNRPAPFRNLENGPPLESSGTMRWRPSDPRPLPYSKTNPYHQASQYQDPKQNTEGKGFQRERGGSPGITGIVEFTKEYKGNLMNPRPPPKPHFAWQHRRPCMPNCTPGLSELWRGVPLF